MQYKQKNFLMAALTGVLSIVVLTAGDCGPGSSSTSSNTSAAGKNIKVYEWVKVGTPGVNFAPTGKSVAHIALSDDAKHFYAAGAGANELYHFDAADWSKASDNTKWKKLDLTATALGGGAALEADISGNANAGVINRLVGTKAGAVISTTNAGGGGTAGAAVIVGNNFKAAWASATNASLAANRAANSLWAGVLKLANGEERVYVANSANIDANSTSAVDIAGAIGAQLGVNYVKATANFTTANMPHFFVNAGGKALIVDKAGLATVAAPGTGGVANYAAAMVAANYGIDATPNTAINDVVGAGDLVYVALNAPAGNTGGVAVFDAKTDAVKGKPDNSWVGKSVLTVAVDPTSKKAWAVMADGLYPIDLATTNVSKIGAATAKFAANGAQPADYATIVDGQEYDKTPALPTANITDAKFDKNGNLFIATSDDHFVVRKAAVKTNVPAPK